ncbi:LAMI_0H06832g1_1 [Lachancea mirantina]|uniref:peptidylprolyl isomerase n=1 Tax=Lachancea mirantina TaxID=1230905 RepID=A0A1G4KFK9_9SACH|nr:LAMI_0H06832g1_1 [Lachancea mirantina]
MGERQVYLDIQIADQKIGRIVIELFDERAPKTTENFYRLCVGDIKDAIGAPLTYRNNFFHRVIKNFMVQAGDITHGSVDGEKSDEIGLGGHSIYFDKKSGKYMNTNFKDNTTFFEDENLGDFDKPFLVGMANLGQSNTNSSQFFITTCISPHLNNNHSILGRVLYGKSVVRTIELTEVDADGFPLHPIKIENCGAWKPVLGLPVYNTSNATIGGDIYEEYPDDDENFDKDVSKDSFAAAETIKGSGTALLKQGDFQNALFKYKKALRYVNELVPDIDSDAKSYADFMQLKAKLYLNLSLTFLKLKNYEDSITYAGFLLDMNKAEEQDKAKAFYRRGVCHKLKGRNELALSDFKNCHSLNPNDNVVVERIKEIETKIEEEKERTRKNLAKFFM